MEDTSDTIAVTVEDLSTGKSDEHRFSRSPVRLGRSTLNDLRLDFPFISAYHGSLVFDRSRIFYVDAARFATTVNGVPAIKDKPVEVGGRDGKLEIGTIRIVVRRTEETIVDPEPLFAPSEASKTATDRVTATDPSQPKTVNESRSGTLVERASAIERVAAGQATMFLGEELHPLLDRALSLVDVLARILFELRSKAPNTVAGTGLADLRDAHALAAYLMDQRREKDQAVGEALALAAEALELQWRGGAGTAGDATAAKK